MQSLDGTTRPPVEGTRRNDEPIVQHVEPERSTRSSEAHRRRGEQSTCKDHRIVKNGDHHERVDDRSASGAGRSVRMTHRTGRCIALFAVKRRADRAVEVIVRRESARRARREATALRGTRTRPTAEWRQTIAERIGPEHQAIGTFREGRRTAAAPIRHPRMPDRHPPTCECHPAARYRALSGVTADMKGNEARRLADRTTQWPERRLAVWLTHRTARKTGSPIAPTSLPGP